VKSHFIAAHRAESRLWEPLWGAGRVAQRLLPYPEDRAGLPAPLSHARAGPPGDLRVHRGLLQSHPSALEQRLSVTRRARSAVRRQWCLTPCPLFWGNFSRLHARVRRAPGRGVPLSSWLFVVWRGKPFSRALATASLVRVINDDGPSIRSIGRRAGLPSSQLVHHRLPSSRPAHLS